MNSCRKEPGQQSTAFDLISWNDSSPERSYVDIYSHILPTHITIETYRV